MKKLFSIAACIAFLGFVSCGSKSEASGQDSDTLATTDVTTQQPEVVAEEPEEDPNDPQVIFDVFSKKLQGGDEVMYFTYDITGNGLPELFVKTGTCEADYELNVYTYEEGNAKKILEKGAGHTGYFQGRGYIIAYWSHMGGFEVSKLTYQNGKIVSKTIASGEPMDDEDEEICYPEVDEPSVDFEDGRNTGALRKALGVSVSKGVYKITSKVIARKGPGKNAKAATKYGIYADVPAEKLYLTTDDFVEATGNVQDGYAEVVDHLIEDESCSMWDDEKVWVPVENLEKVDKCTHSHLMRDGLI